MTRDDAKTMVKVREQELVELAVRGYVKSGRGLVLLQASSGRLLYVGLNDPPMRLLLQSHADDRVRGWLEAYDPDTEMVVEVVAPTQKDGVFSFRVRFRDLEGTAVQH